MKLLKTICVLILLAALVFVGVLTWKFLLSSPAAEPVAEPVAYTLPREAQGETGNVVTEPQDAPAAQPVPTQEPAPQKPSVLLVNADHPLPEDFATGALVELYGEERSFKLATSDIQLETATFEAANRMFLAAAEDGIDDFILTSGFRTAEKQQALFDADTTGTAARPGCSEHQTGLAFDVTTHYEGDGFQTTPQYEWLIKNCWDYGFILRYPEDGEAITGFPYEPWHYRYVGKEIAQEIRDNGWTLEEYCAE